MIARLAARANATNESDSRWPALPEVALGACLIALAIFTAIFEDGDVPGDEGPSAWWHWLLVVGPAIPVAFRRSAPLIATPISVMAQIALWGVGLASAFFAPVIMIYTVASEAGQRGRQMALASAAALCAMTLLGVIVADDVTIDLLVFTALGVTVAYLLGIQTAQRRQAEISLAEQLAVAQSERDAAQVLAAANERQRIARELHDIVGHSLSIIAVRAEAADRVAPKNPEAAVDAVSAIATTARSSLSDVRRVLAGLREEDADVELAPVPSFASLPGLVNSFAEAGMKVSLQGDAPDDATMGAAIGAGTFRIVQEALTNVLKHGGPNAQAAVELQIADDQLVVEVTDTGRGTTTATNNDGLGLAGMRERAEVLGGSLVSGAKSGGGYRVCATLPVAQLSAGSS